MALGLTPTIAICLTAGVVAGAALARPGDSSSTADSRYESVSGEVTDEPSGAGDPGPGYGEPAPAGGSAPVATDGAPADGAVSAITIADFDFSGDTQVAPGAAIEVTNLDGATHTLTSNDDAFDTGRLAQDDSATITAPDEPGEYSFFCEIHPSMRGTLVVG